MCRQSATVCLIKSPTVDGTAGLLPDPRRRRGVRHPFVAVLLVATSAVVAGARSYAAVGQWSANAPQHTLARLGARVLGPWACASKVSHLGPGRPPGIKHPSHPAPRRARLANQAPRNDERGSQRTHVRARGLKIKLAD
ncbi:transposase family protein [Streptomyces sp. NBC_00464]|uniref:transposase family protein n=1 Tax=Streptomyces sp. NBC_00464 TaxID=2975751 RepID=UPI0030DE392F